MIAFVTCKPDGSVTVQPITAVQMVRWFIASGPRWSVWHLTQEGKHTWCSRKIQWKHPAFESKDWHGERSVCGICLRHLHAHGARKGT